MTANTRNLTLLLCAGVLSAVLSAAAAQPQTSPVVEVMRQSGSFGAGVRIDQTTILTAAHVVRDGGTVAIWSINGKLTSGTVIDADEDLDIALVQDVNLDDSVPIAHFSCEMPKPFTVYHTTSMPLGHLWVTQSTKLADGAPQTPRLVVANGPSMPGMSGGPMFDTATGLVYGTVSTAINPSSAGIGTWIGVVPSAAACVRFNLGPVRGHEPRDAAPE